MKKILEKIKPTSKWRQNLIEYGTATILIAVVVWFVVNKNMDSSNQEIKQEVEQTHGTVQRLQTQIDSVMLFQGLLVQKTNELEATQEATQRLIEKGNSLLYQNVLAIEKIKIEYNEKVNAASNYNYHELDSFFTNRYKEF